MRLKSSAYLFLTGTILMNQVFADGFSAQNGSPSITRSESLRQYVSMISGFKPETAALSDRLAKTVDYYRRVHILKTISKNNYTVDCIPFAEQPALIDNPVLAQRLLPLLISSTQKNIKQLEKIGEHFDFNTAKECPLGSIGVLRPSKNMLTSALANKKVAPNSRKERSASFAAGYTWEQGYTPEGSMISIPTEANQAYFKGPQNQYVNSAYGDDHSLNQFWFTTSHDSTSHPREILTYSAEYGIIASSYFTTDVSTSIFVFASVDNYGARSCYNLECPHFVQAPGTPVLGAPIASKNVDYIFKVKHQTSGGLDHGYYYTLIIHRPTRTLENSSSVLLGYFPDSIYDVGDLPAYFSAGAEVYAMAPSNGTLMSGNYVNPCAGYTRPKQIGIYSQNGNSFPYYSSIEPSPYGLVWHFGQSELSK